MVRINERLKVLLKKPLGQVAPFSRAFGTVKERKIIAVGDEIVFNFLEQGIVPFVSVFDLKTLREPVRKWVEERIKEKYPEPLRMEKPAGELSGEMFSVAQNLLKDGGALFVDGEEDLFALPFSLLISEEVVVYGQPGKGCVIVEKDSFDKGKIEKELRELGLLF